MNVRVVTFPEGQDPDSYAQELGGIAFRDFLDEESVDFITFKAVHLIKETKDDPLKKAGVIRSVLESIAKIPDAILTRMYLKETSSLLGIQEEILIDEFNKIYLKDQGDKAKKISKEEQELLRKQVSTEPNRAISRGLNKKEVSEDQQKEIIRLLITFSNDEIDEGLTFAKYVLQELNEFEFSVPVFKKIFDEFRQGLSKDEIPSSGYFVQHADDEVQNLAITFLSREREISPYWEDKHQLIIIDENDQLGKVAFKSLTRLNWRKIRVMHDELNIELKKLEEEGSVNRVMEIMKKVMYLKEIERDIAKELGNVIPGG